MTYEILYTRTQSVYIEVDASSQEEAESKAWRYVESLDLSSSDDESDDPGELWVALKEE